MKCREMARARGVCAPWGEGCAGSGLLSASWDFPSRRPDWRRLLPGPASLCG